MPLRPLVLCAAVSLGIVLGACGNDDGADVRAVGSTTSASGSASGTGLSLDDTRTGATDDPLVAAAVEDYRGYVQAQVDTARRQTRVFTGAVRAGDLAAARAAYAPSRVGWERIEPIAGLVEDIDVAVDARVDDFAGARDPAFTGWHRLEYLLFEDGTTRGAGRFADRLDADLARLDRAMQRLEIPPVAMALGAAELIEEVSLGKITGEEDRYSKTDLWDIDANVDGAERVIDLLTPALERAEPELLARIRTGLTDLRTALEPFARPGGGFLAFCLPDDMFPSDRCPGPTVTPAQLDGLKARLAAVSEDLALVPGALGLG